MNNKMRQAELLARFVHFSQKRQDGEDYIKHCERVAEEVGNEFCDSCTLDFTKECKTCNRFEDIICAAWLHDVMEDYEGDSAYIGKIIKESFGENVFNLVVNVTNKNNPYYKFKNYNDYILYVFGQTFIAKDLVQTNKYEEFTPYLYNHDCKTIKWFDMIDNTSYNIPEHQRNKYRNACIFLQNKGIVVPTILKERLKI